MQVGDAATGSDHSITSSKRLVKASDEDTRDGVIVLEEVVVVACDSNRSVSSVEVDFFTWCIGGRGMLWAQLANPTAESRAYIFSVGILRRSTTAEAFGAAFRGISGRPDGVYGVTVEVGRQVIYSEAIEVDCE